jgi:hypothetical protein
MAQGSQLKSISLEIYWPGRLQPQIFPATPMQNLKSLEMNTERMCEIDLEYVSLQLLENRHREADRLKFLKVLPSVEVLRLTRFQFTPDSNFASATSLTSLSLEDCVVYPQLRVPRTLKSLSLDISGWNPILGPAPLPALEELRLKIYDQPLDVVKHVITTQLPLHNEDYEEPEEEFSKLKVLLLSGFANTRDGSLALLKDALMNPRLYKVETLELAIETDDSIVTAICGMHRSISYSFQIAYVCRSLRQA